MSGMPPGALLLADQPMNGAGPWFSGLRTQWHRQQLSDMRLAGIEVALLRTQPNDPLLGRELDAFVEALKEMKAQKLDYPLVGVDATHREARFGSDLCTCSRRVPGHAGCGGPRAARRPGL